MAHPTWALQHKSKGTELRNIGGRYYLYRISSKWDKERKVTRKITHEMIGRITEQEGLIPRISNKRGRKKAAPSSTTSATSTTTPTTKPNLSAKEYGASALLCLLAEDILTKLKHFFPHTALQLFVLAINRLLYQAPLKNMQFFYEHSMLAEQFKNLPLSKNKLTSLIKDLGTNREAISEFMKSFASGLEHILLDSTHLFSSSTKMQLNEVGYNSQGRFDPQVNLLYLFSSQPQNPVYYRILPGNIQGMQALKRTIQEAKLKDATVIGDKGFCSLDNMAALQEAGLKYLLPLKRNSNFVNYERMPTRAYQQAFDGHFFYQKRIIYYYYQQPQEGKRLVTFYDPKLGAEEENCYLSRIGKGVEGYSLENFQKKQLTMGTLSLITNLEGEGASPPVASKLYEQYKSRMEIEVGFDMYKNLLEADRSYMQSDSSLEGWLFINHIASLMYYRVFQLIREKEKLSSLSPKDLLTKLARVQKIRLGQEWAVGEINSSSAKLFKALDIHVT